MQEVEGGYVPQNVCGGQRATLWTWFSSSSFTLFLETELRWSGLGVGTLIYWATSWAPRASFERVNGWDTMWLLKLPNRACMGSAIFPPFCLWPPPGSVATFTTVRSETRLLQRPEQSSVAAWWGEKRFLGVSGGYCDETHQRASDFPHPIHDLNQQVNIIN